MMQTRPDSIIEIWSNYYLKYPNKREKKIKTFRLFNQNKGQTERIILLNL